MSEQHNCPMALGNDEACPSEWLCEKHGCRRSPPTQRYECPDILEAALTMLRHEVQRVLCNLKQESSDPFGNTGGSFDCGEFSVCAYSWGDDDEQLWNFIHPKSGIAVSWYKYFGRGMSVCRDVSADDAAALLRDCLDSMRRVECGELQWSEPGLEMSLQAGAAQ